MFTERKRLEADHASKALLARLVFVNLKFSAGAVTRFHPHSYLGHDQDLTS